MARANFGGASRDTNADVEMTAPLILLAICVRLVGRPPVSHLSLRAATRRPTARTKHGWSTCRVGISGRACSRRDETQELNPFGCFRP